MYIVGKIHWICRCFLTWCLVHWNTEIPPTSGFDQSYFADRSRFIIGPILVWISAHGLSFIFTLMDGNLCLSQCARRRNAGVFNNNFLFSQKLLYCWNGIFWDNLLYLQIWFQIFFTGDIPFCLVTFPGVNKSKKNPSNTSYNYLISLNKRQLSVIVWFGYNLQIEISAGADSEANFQKSTLHKRQKKKKGGGGNFWQFAQNL